MNEPKRIARAIPVDHWHRASAIPKEMVGPYLSQIAIELQQRIDFWRFHKAPPHDVDTALDAFNALWTEYSQRDGMLP